MNAPAVATVLQVLLAFATVAIAPASSTPADGSSPSVFTLDAPPAEVAGALRDLRSDDVARRKAAAAALAKLLEAEPYLRHYRATEPGKSDGFAGDALDELVLRRGARIVKRAPEWGKEGRFDLLVDGSMHLDSKQADAVAEQFFVIGNAIRPVPQQLGGPKSGYALAEGMAYLTNNRNLYRLHEPTKPVETAMASQGFVRARACETSSSKLYRWLFVTRDSLRGVHEKHNEMENCYVFHNGDLSLDDINWSLVVCDGDVEFVNHKFVKQCVVIARGSIRSERGLLLSSSALYAQGDIVTKGLGNADALLYAGGKVDVPELKSTPRKRVEKSGVKENPFPVRFFETADVGVEAALKGDALTITKLTPGSPLTKSGVKEGDVVTQMNEKVIKSANDFRRELRYSVALEAGIFHITRGNEKITRVVYFKNGLEK